MNGFKLDRDSIVSAFQDMDSRTRLRLGMVLGGVLVILIALSALNSRITALEKKRLSRESDLAEMMKLKLRYQEANTVSQRLTNRLLATRADDSPAKIIEEIGIKGKSSQVKPLKGEERPGFIEDAAEVKLEGLSANETINLLYRLEKGAKPVVLKRANLKVRYDDPSKLDIALIIALLKPAPQDRK